MRKIPVGHNRIISRAIYMRKTKAGKSGQNWKAQICERPSEGIDKVKLRGRTYTTTTKGKARYKPCLRTALWGIREAAGVCGENETE